MPHIPITFSISMCIGRDADNALMRRSNRTAWSEEDWDAAATAAQSALMAVEEGRLDGAAARP